MPEWVLLLVAILAALGAAALIVYAMREEAREERALDELFYGWWRVGGRRDP